MWICLNRAFLSIVDDPDNPDSLLVRARRKGDIESVFGDVCRVRRTPERDYLFRASIPRTAVAAIIADEVSGINYGNFKASVRNKRLHDAFSRVWSIMAGLQPTAPYSGLRAGRQRRLPMGDVGMF